MPNITLEQLLGEGHTPESFLKSLLDSWVVDARKDMDASQAVLELLSLYPHPSNTMDDSVWSKCSFYKDIKRALLVQYAKVFTAVGIPIKLLQVTNVLCPTLHVKSLIRTLNLTELFDADLRELTLSNRIFYMAYVSKKGIQDEMSIKERVHWLKLIGVPNESIDKLLVYLVPFIKDRYERKQPKVA